MGEEPSPGEKGVAVRIGIVAPPWVQVPPTQYGGTEGVVDRLARGFAERGHDVLLWTVGCSTCPVPKGWVFPEDRPQQLGVATTEIRHVIAGYEAMREWGADLVHDHTLSGPLLAPRFPELEVVATNHGPFDEELIDLYRTISDRAWVVGISHDQASRAGSVRLAGVIHHGLDLDEFPFGTGQGDDRGEYFLFLGRMAATKGVRRAALAARRAGVRLLIAAKMREPGERRYFDEEVAPLLDDDVQYLGEVDAATRLSLLQGATALVNPICWPEPFGLVMIESMACGTPVLSTPYGAAPELVEHGVTGFLCEDDEEVVARIPQTRELGREACRDWVARWFSSDRMVEEHLALFERIVAGRRLSTV